MAHFAKVENGVVTNIIVVADSDCAGGQFPQSESAGKAFIASLGLFGQWLQCSYSGSFRGCYPGVNYSYDADSDCFIAPTVNTP